MRWNLVCGIVIGSFLTVPAHALVIDPVDVGMLKGEVLNGPVRPFITSPLDVSAGAGIVIFRQGTDSSLFLSAGVGGLRDFNITSADSSVMVPPAGITGRTITLRASTLSLTGGGIYGTAMSSPAVVTVGLTGTPVGVSVAPVPLPAALPLFVTGVGFISMMRKRWLRERSPSMR